MIIKEIDSKVESLQLLESLLAGKITPNQRKNIQAEINALKKGAAGEKQAAFYINQIFSKSFKAHDIRLNVDGDIAQIDHVVMNKGF